MEKTYYINDRIALGELLSMKYESYYYSSGLFTDRDVYHITVVIRGGIAIHPVIGEIYYSPYKMDNSSVMEGETIRHAIIKAGEDADYIDCVVVRHEWEHWSSREIGGELDSGVSITFYVPRGTDVKSAQDRLLYEATREYYDCELSLPDFREAFRKFMSNH